MSYWANNPELYTEIIFKEMVSRKMCDKASDPEEMVDKFFKDDPNFWKIAVEAERNYWADRMDDAKERISQG